jgi:hypothetical protein
LLIFKEPFKFKVLLNVFIGDMKVLSAVNDAEFVVKVVILLFIVFICVWALLVKSFA